MPVNQIEARSLVPFSYRGGVKLQETCWLEGKPYFSRRAIGMWLGYRDPKDAVAHLLRRHRFISESPHRRVVILSTLEGDRQVTREMEVFDPIGLMLIAFKAETPKAIKCQIAAAHLMWAYVNGELKPKRSYPRPDWDHRMEQLAEIAGMRSYTPERAAAIRLMAQDMGCSYSGVAQKVQTIRCGDRDPLTCRYRPKRGFRGITEEQQRVLEQALAADPRTSAPKLQKMLSGEHIPSTDTILRFKRHLRKTSAEQFSARLLGIAQPGRGGP